MPKHTILNCWLSVAVILGVSVNLLTGCGSKSVSENSIEQISTLTTSIAPATVVNGSSVVVEATLTNNGVVVSGETVTFSVTPAGSGTFNPATVATDSVGIAATTFSPNVTGNLTITASVLGGSITSDGVLTVTETQQTGDGTINLSVTPSLLLANGSDTSTVIATVFDNDGAPVPDGVIVKLVAGEKFDDLDGNGYWSPGIDNLVYDANGNGQWDAYGLIPATSMTTGGIGRVIVDFVAGTNAQTVYIKATVDDQGVSGTAEVSIQLTPDAHINAIYLSSDSINLSVKQTGGIEIAAVRASCFDINGNAMPEGLTVNFIILDGPGGGEHFDTVGYGPYATVTNGQGIATATVHSGTIPGTIRIRAYADSILSNATQVMVSAGPPYYIAVGATCNVPYWGIVAGENEITAVVSDIYLNPVNDSTVVYFSSDEGTMKSHEARTQDLEGIAYTKWFSGTNILGSNGRVMIMAETAGGTVADTSMFYNSWIPDTLITNGVPSSIIADGVTKAVVTVVGLDLNDNPVIGGTLFEGDASYLSVVGGVLQNGCQSSWARVKIRSATLLSDQSMTGGIDDTVGAWDNVVYWSGGAATSYQVALRTGPSSSITSQFNGPSSANGNQTIRFSATIKDRFGNPLGDHTLVMSSASGTVINGSQETNTYGESYGFQWTAPPADSVSITYLLSLTDTDPMGGIIMTKQVTVASQ